MYKDHTPSDYGLPDYEDFWTIALINRGGRSHREVHFGVFTLTGAMEAMESGKVTTLDDEKLELRRIRRFPD
jgi:hypothetical protein